MPPVSLVRAFIAQWWTAGFVLFLLSIRTAYQGSDDPHLVLIGGFEALSALLFLFPRTLKIGAIGLLSTLAIAFLLHAARLEFRGDLLVYAAVVVFIAMHGPVPMSWLRTRG
jgi:hypothetical protein